MSGCTSFSDKIIDLINGEKEFYMQEFTGIYDGWEKKLDNDEWYFSNSFEKIINRLSSVEAYDYIPTVINELIKLRHSYLIGETLDFLHSLYNRADTTEIHPILKKNIEL